MTAGEAGSAARRVREAVAGRRARSPDWHAACFRSDSRAADNRQERSPHERARPSSSVVPVGTGTRTGSGRHWR